ncbi:MAG: flagellar hook-basal body protein [Syntrophales bacterium]|jgi:flagellar basal-body rod protein FlgF
MIYGIMANVYQQTFDQLDFITNNVANSNTNGFKVVKLYHNAPDPEKETAFIPQIVVDYSPGTIQKTDNPLDVAVDGEGFFAIQSEQGESYTRQGNFTIDKDGNLVTADGDYVLGKSGNKIKITDGEINIGEKGGISVAGNPVDTLKIVSFNNPQALVKVKGCLYADPGNAGLADKNDPSVKQGHIELSNVQIVKEMADMIDLHRSVEIYQKVIQTTADQDKLSTSQLGRLAA